MTPALPWSTAFRIAWREMHASRAKFLFVIVAVAVGVGSLTGVRGFSRSFRRMLLRDARTLMAADMTARIFGAPTAEQEAVFRNLAARGVERTWITETVTMASSSANPDPLLVSVKAVDPSVYPFYGEVVLNPPQPLRTGLDAHTVVVTDDLLLRLNVNIGDMLRIGGQDFRIVGAIRSEPDRMTGTLNVGPRVMITRKGLDRTGLISLGSRASERFLFKLPATGSPGPGEVRAILKKSLPEATIADYRETHPIITRGLDRSTTFLSLIGLIALVIGAMGVGSAMHGHLQQRLDSIAVMKCVGGRSGQVIRIYTAQTLLLGLGGGLLGVVFGTAVAGAFPSLLARYFTIQASVVVDAWPALQGIGVACLVTLLFTLPPLLGIRTIRPAQIFRRDMEPEVVERHRRVLHPFARENRAALWAGAAILVGTGLVAATLTDGGLRIAARTGAYFTLALTAGVAALAATAWILLRGVRLFLRHAPERLPSGFRQGIANLYRPGNQAQAAVVALGVGVMFTLAVFLIQSRLLEQIRTSAPPGTPNVFLLDIPGGQKQAVADLIRRQSGVEEAPDVTGAVAARITAVDGTPVDRLPLHDWGRRFLRTRSVTEMADQPPDMQILSGTWWNSRDHTPLVAVTDEAAHILNLKPGSTLDWSIWNRTIRTRVACIQRTESLRMAARFEFIFNPGQLDNLPAVYYGSARVRPAAVAPLQRVMFQRFPTVTVINMADVMQTVEEVVDRISLVVRFISAFTILAGAIMVASSVAGTRFRRMREVVILKTLGATRRSIAGIFSVEFVVLGAVAGLMGSLLASGFAALILKFLMEISPRFDPLATGVTVLLAALIAAASGWAASFRTLGRKPLEILREE
jgi:putative ABC transport system permease protein